ncbi:MAG: glutathione S-transferase family protein [Gammaproteobacteria bacterium]|nr:glutathione S-transferase family protein [Gammaproteobacteria bacterium]
MLLHSFFITPNNRKVEAFIKHFDLDVEIHQVNFRERENQTDKFLAMNPMGKVPVLVDGDLNLWESNAILTYLATVFPQTHTLPADPKSRADVDRWLHWQSCHLMPAMGRLKTDEDADPVTLLQPLFKVLDIQLQDKEYVCGELSVADFAIAAYTLTKLGRQYDYSEVSNVAAWRDRMAQLKGFIETHYKAPGT